MDIVKIKASDYGLEETKAKQIKQMFGPMLDKMESLEKDYNKIIKSGISHETCIKARDLRLQYVKVRTGIVKIHKELKQFYLQGGRFVDGLKNAQLMASQGNEGKLMDIENYYENLEKEQISKLQTKREKELLKFDVDYIPSDLGGMDVQVWENYLTGARVNYETRKEAEQKAEEEKKEAERIQKLFEEREQILMPFYQWWESKMDISNFGHLKESEFNDILKSLKQKKSDWESEQKRIRDENKRLQLEVKKREEHECKEREAFETKLKKEREDREKAEAKLEAKAQEESRKQALKDAEIQAELNKGDVDKVKDLCADLKSLKTKYIFKSAKNKKMYSDTGVLLDKVINHVIIKPAEVLEPISQ